MTVMAGRGTTRITLGARLVDVGVARRFVREMLAEEAPTVVDDVQLIASELVTNAIEHGPAGPLSVEIDRGDAVVELTVRSPNPPGGIDSLQRRTFPSVEATSGRGFGIVKHVADRVEVRCTDEHLTVVAQRRI